MLWDRLKDRQKRVGDEELPLGKGSGCCSSLFRMVVPNVVCSVLALGVLVTFKALAIYPKL